ncbi:Phospholipase A1-Ialpha2 [Hibiscus syriacus]|uniref:Phospholipase A1-Ialpha2 n=1 Tax=Hibiscus syriacus TaxID=106335 RepID=A0A6A2Y7Q5_HIBSY|nr:galactolipase DONGLE, chloroplastic-like [Hibiscus syriacus]KAE8665584.1 Phospholipase A1-Ialpha2 [Hibiscus syriacus]
MASKVLIPSLNLNSVRNNSQPRSFGHVCLPRKSGFSSPSSMLKPATTAASTSEKTATSTCVLSRLWREVQGSNNWENLLEPLDPLLREEIIRYGEFVAACYKAFDLDPNSKRYWNCRYGKKSILKGVGMENSGYKVTKYIYATPDINIPTQNGASRGRWIGYVAVSSDETVKWLGRRDLLITFRGTVTNHEWLTNFMSSLTPARLNPHDSRPELQVESGFLSLYTSGESDSKFGLESCREQLLAEVSRLLNEYKGQELSITLAGHSLGSALALLLAYDMSELGLNKPVNSDNNKRIPVTVFSFGGPRVGNLSFKQRCDELGIKVLRVVNVNDPITKLPGVFLNENFTKSPWRCSCYVHVGVELALDFFDVRNPPCVHDLETYINFLKWPETWVDPIDNKDVVDLWNRARGFLSSAHNFYIDMPWIEAAINMVNIIQSQ